MKENIKNKSSNVIDINGMSINDEKSDKNAEVSNMKNNSVSVETYQKLNRAKNVSFFMHLQVRELEANAMPLMWIPDIFSYISEDMQAIMNELREKGSFSAFENKQPDDE